MNRIIAGGLGLIALIVIAATDAGVAADKSGRSCQIRGKRLYGKVKVVNSFADLKVQVVNAFPDLKVQRVTAFPNQCGKWQFVTHGEDFTVQFVTAFPDLKIQFVSAFPGR